MDKKFGVLVSGTGTLLDALVAAGFPVAVVGADRPCLALEKAGGYGIETRLFDRADYGNLDPKLPGSFRDQFSHDVAVELKALGINFTSMAGWGTLFTQPFFDVYGDDSIIIKNHPALLPAFKGWHPVRDALAAGVKFTGCTIHHATVDMDEGRIIAQMPVPVLDGDTEETLQGRIKEAERPLLVQVLKDLMGLNEAPPTLPFMPRDGHCHSCDTRLVPAGSVMACPRCTTVSGG